MTSIHDEVPRGERQAMIDEIEELRAENAMLKTSWGLAKDAKIISASDNLILVDQPPSGTRVRLSMACPKQFDKQREALELCREYFTSEIDTICRSWWSKHDAARKAVEECL